MANEQEDLEVNLEGEENPEMDNEFKPQDLPEVKLAKAKAIASRYAKQAERLERDLGIEKPKQEAKQSGELDYGQKAFLIANGIKNAEEIELVKKVQSTTGKSLEEILESKYFKADLKDLRDKDEVEEALPKGTKRSGGTSKDSVEYWVNTPPEKFSAVPDHLKREVLAKQLDLRKNGNKFTSRPYIAGSNSINSN